MYVYMLMYVYIHTYIHHAYICIGMYLYICVNLNLLYTYILQAARGEPFFKMHESPGHPTRGMLALNNIIQGSKHFVPPPPTKDVYKVVTKSVVHRDPLVAAS